MRTVNQKRSKLQEIKAASQYDGRLTPGSGNGWVKKADVRTDTELIELKTTTKATYPLSARELQKHWDHALIDGRIPVFEIQFTDPSGHVDLTCVVLDKNDYLIVRERD